MFIVFVTGSLASGKHAACTYLAKQGFTHIDLDEMAKEFYEEDFVKWQIIDAYGKSICDASGQIVKAKLAEVAFAKEGASDALNSIIWPLVNARLADIIVGSSSELNRLGEKLAVEIAMLAEAPEMAALADSVLGIEADEDIRIKRALARGMKLEDILNRIALQASDATRAKLCDYVIENNGSLEEFEQKLELWLQSQQEEHMF